MNSRTWSDLFILLLLPLPLTVVVLFIGLLYLIAYPDTFDSNTISAEVAPQPTRTLSEQAQVIATFNAAPVYVAAPPNIAGAAAVEVAAAMGYSDAMVKSGQGDFLAICSACHGVDGRGVSGLGKDLVNSEFVHGLNDQELLQFIIVGRNIWDEGNTTGVAMPARGGNPGLTDEDILDIIAYVRVIGGEAVPTTSTVAMMEAGTTETSTTDTSFAPINPSALLESSGVEAPEFADVEFTPFDVSGLLASLGLILPDPLPQPERTGETLYNDFCGKGYDAEVYAYQGPRSMCDFLLESVQSGELDDAQVIELLQQGSPIWAADELADVHIPARGGYPVMTDAELEDFVEYLHSIAAEAE
jgi:mono/diheme cytochrome c family protein